MSAGSCKLGGQRVIDPREFQRPAAPSTVLRQHEASMVADLARMAHLDGRRFTAWPTLTLEPENSPWPDGAPGYWLLRAEVVAER